MVTPKHNMDQNTISPELSLLAHQHIDYEFMEYHVISFHSYGYIRLRIRHWMEQKYTPLTKPK